MVMRRMNTFDIGSITDVQCGFDVLVGSFALLCGLPGGKSEQEWNRKSDDEINGQDHFEKERAQNLDQPTAGIFCFSFANKIRLHQLALETFCF